MSELDVYGQFFHARRRAEKYTISEKTGSCWGRYGSPLSDYEQTFGYSEPNPISAFIRKREVAGKSSLALDLFGEGTAIRDLSGKEPGLVGGLSLTLCDNRSEQRARLDAERNLHVVGGDIFRGSTWHKIHAFLDSIPIEDNKFNITLYRPILGDFNVPAHPAIRGFLLQKVYETLSEDGGVLLAQGLKILHESDLYRWTEMINNTPGLQVEFNCENPDSNNVMKLTKTKGAPAKLPLLESFVTRRMAFE
jgi:hypothetical protein